MKVVFDTNILRSDPSRSKSSFHALNNLRIRSAIEIYIPEIVAREFISYRELDLKKSAQEVIKKIKENRLIAKEPADYLLVREMEDRLAEIRDRSIAKETDDFYKWQILYDVKIILSIYCQLDEVLELYFSGSPPFAFPKDREALPDAMIVSCINNYFENKRDVAIISNDKRFREGLDKSFVSVGSIDDFLKLPKIVDLLVYDATDIENRAIIRVLNELKFCLSFIETGVGKEILDSAEDFYEFEELDDGYFQSFEGIHLNFTVNNPVYLGDSQFSFPINGNLELALYKYFDPVDNEEIDDHMDNGFETVIQNHYNDDPEYILLRKAEYHNFNSRIIVDFGNISEIAERIVKYGVFVSMYAAHCYVEDINFVQI